MGVSYLSFRHKIKQRKNGERESRTRDEQYRDILENMEEGYYEVDIAGHFTSFNDSLCKILACPRAALMCKGFEDFTDLENHRIAYGAFNRVFRTGIPSKGFDWEIVRSDGSRRNVEASISLMRDPGNGLPTGFRGILRDITNRKAAEKALHESEEKFRVLVEQSPLGISLIDKHNRYEYINPKFIEMFGYTLEEIPTGREWFRKAYPDKDYRSRVVNDWLNGLKEHGVGEARPLTHDVCCKDGSSKLIHFRSVTMATGEQITFYEDITEQKSLESQLFLAQKVESLATLAGGMAHNFNNLLMGIQGNNSLMLLESDEFSHHHDRLKNIEKLVQSGSKLTHQLLGYARKGKYEVRPICLNQLVRETSDTFCVTRKEIRIQRKLCDGECGIMADQGQIEQVLLNLYVNAADAMRNGGDISIETGHVVIGTLESGADNLRPGEYVLLKVSDRGTGMDNETVERIFDPFFTTKELGKGTGLGLASVYGIIKSHGGFIDVDSQKGHGTTFSIYLPKSEEPLEEVTKGSPDIIRGKGTVLMVDDEYIVLEVCVEYLRSLGFNVLHAKSGKEAVTIFKENSEIIDLVVLDLIMPEMGGSETYDMIKSINPEIKVLLSSGYSVDWQATEIMERGCNGFIQKPFDLETLSQNIYEILSDG